MATDPHPALSRRQLLLGTAPLAPLMFAATAGADTALAAAPRPVIGVPATDFGVRPGYAVDQTDRLQAAIDAAADAQAPLLLPPGVTLATGLVLRPNSVLIGTGPTSRLALARPGTLLGAAHAGAVRIADVSLYGGQQLPPGGEAAPLVRFDNVARVLFDNVALRQTSGNALELHSSGGAVTGCHVAGAGQAGIFAIDSTGLEISRNTVEDCANNGIQVWRSGPGEDATIVAHNRVRRIRADGGGSGQNGNGINVFRAHGVIVQGNRIEDCAFSAVRSNGGSDCQILGNSCARLGEVALYAEFDFQGAVIASNLVDEAASGISITNFNDGGRLAVCQGNLIRNLHTREGQDARGNGISAEADTMIVGNVVENAPVAGIHIGWGHHLRDVAATSNVVRDCGVGIAVSVTFGAGPVLLASNLIAKPKAAAIQGFDYLETAGGDLLDTPDRWPHITATGNVRA